MDTQFRPHVNTLIRNHTSTQLDARTLSSGTMAVLTGARDYATLDVYQAEFVKYCDLHPEFGTWQDAWDKYTNG